MIITIDGPTASGKSTTARALARRLGYYHLNSGLAYRAFAYLYMAADAAKAADPMAAAIEVLNDPELVQYQWDADQNVCIMVHNVDITAVLKTAQIDQASSILSSNKVVRTAVNHFLHSIADKHDLVADGRDCGSELFPQAELKVFLTASLDERAERWRTYKEKHGEHFSIEQARQEVEKRDARDIERPIAPLHVPVGAFTVDNTGLSLDETVAIVEGKLK
jgi:cytidylate kinase